jgi:hypothetical protein
MIESLDRKEREKDSKSMYSRVSGSYHGYLLR